MKINYKCHTCMRWSQRVACIHLYLKWTYWRTCTDAGEGEHDQSYARCLHLCSLTPQIIQKLSDAGWTTLDTTGGRPFASSLNTAPPIPPREYIRGTLQDMLFLHAWKYRHGPVGPRAGLLGYVTYDFLLLPDLQAAQIFRPISVSHFASWSCWMCLLFCYCCSLAKDLLEVSTVNPFRCMQVWHWMNYYLSLNILEILDPPESQEHVPIASTASFFCRGKGREVLWIVDGKDVRKPSGFWDTLEDRGFTFSCNKTFGESRLNMSVLATVENNNTNISCKARRDDLVTSQIVYLTVIGTKSCLF